MGLSSLVGGILFELLVAAVGADVDTSWVWWAGAVGCPNCCVSSLAMSSSKPEHEVKGAAHLAETHAVHSVEDGFAAHFPRQFIMAQSTTSAKQSAQFVENPPWSAMQSVMQVEFPRQLMHELTD
mmetsp:Transcript_16101/g.31113  ORF Transcript_16101/g.31113 Transcript_16101/m.31113 type:complete len:125 (+) Transcript_16101:1636-2010(+)